MELIGLRLVGSALRPTQSNPSLAKKGQLNLKI
jgi:hypothetical protein